MTDKLFSPMNDGDVSSVVSFMNCYHMTREDWNSVVELTVVAHSLYVAYKISVGF